MSFSVGTTGALMVMIVVALWLWRAGGRPVKSAALSTAMIAMVVAITLEVFLPIAFKSREEGWSVFFSVLIGAAGAVGLGAFVRFVLVTIGTGDKAP